MRMLERAKRVWGFVSRWWLFMVFVVCLAVIALVWIQGFRSSQTWGEAMFFLLAPVGLFVFGWFFNKTCRHEERIERLEKRLEDPERRGLKKGEGATWE